MTATTKEYLVPLGWRVPEPVRNAIKEIAARRGESAERVAREALQRYLDQERSREHEAVS